MSESNSKYYRPVKGVYRIKSSSGHYLQLSDSGSVTVQKFDRRCDRQKWVVNPIDVNAKGVPEVFNITSADDRYVLSVDSGEQVHGKAHEEKGSKPTEFFQWRVEVQSEEHPTRIKHEATGRFLQVPDEGSELQLQAEEDAYSWVFEFEDREPGTFQRSFFPLTPEEVARDEYDIIIVGSGIGGGVLANDLWDTNHKLGERAKKILLIERGGLVFHSHCLNTARPSGLAKDRGQQNDTFFEKFWSHFEFDEQQDLESWKGGPMYNLGGRSAAWGLFAPRIHDQSLADYFQDTVVKTLHDEYYDKAERLMKVSFPVTKPIHQHVMDRLNAVGHLKDKSEDLSKTALQWKWGHIASEFREENNFDFAEGAYSTIDKLLEIAMSKPKLKTKQNYRGSSTGKDVEFERLHKHFRILLNAEVQSVVFDDIRTKKSNAKGVLLKSSNGGRGTYIKLNSNEDSQVVLCAGSVDSPAILLRSVDERHINNNIPLDNYAETVKNKWKFSERNGLKITDHDIWYFQRSFEFTEPGARAAYGAMKLQTYVRLGDTDDEIALANMSIDASSFLPRADSSVEDVPKLILVFVLKTDLLEGCDISLDPDTKEPKVRILRPECQSDKQKGEQYEKNLAKMKTKMKALAKESMRALQQSMKVDFKLGLDNFGKSDPSNVDDQLELGRLQLGGVAHELGTLPMVSPRLGNSKLEKVCLDENLQFMPDISKRVSVCDLSLFPYSPEVNPTITLAALAIRLSRHLSDRTWVNKPDPNQFRVINHSGFKIQVYISKAKPDPHEEEHKLSAIVPKLSEIPPGEYRTWEADSREAGPQSMSVYKLDPEKLQEWEGKAFSDELPPDDKLVYRNMPHVMIAHLGKLTTVF